MTRDSWEYWEHKPARLLKTLSFTNANNSCGISKGRCRFAGRRFRNYLPHGEFKTRHGLHCRAERTRLVMLEVIL